MEEPIRLILGNFPLFCLILALLFSFLMKERESYGEKLTRYLLLFPVGLAGIWGFYFHAFYPEFTAQQIGWETCEFQYEVAMANLGIGVAGIVGFRRSRDYALAVILVVSCFLWGAAFNHVRQILIAANYASGNAGSILATDILIPIALWIGYYRWKEKKR